MISECNSHEVAGIEYISAFYAQLAQSERYLEPRLKSVPDAWRQYRMAFAAAGKALDLLYTTVPPKVLRHLQRLTENGEVVIRQRQIVKSPDYHLVPEDALRMLVNIAIESKCTYCMNDSKMAKRCKLRKALMLIVPPDTLESADCPYSDIAIQNDAGEYISEGDSLG